MGIFACFFGNSVNRSLGVPEKRQPLSPETAHTAGGSDCMGAIKAPGLSPALSFVPWKRAKGLRAIFHKSTNSGPKLALDFRGAGMLPLSQSGYTAAYTAKQGRTRKGGNGRKKICSFFVLRSRN